MKLWILTLPILLLSSCAIFNPHPTRQGIQDTDTTADREFFFSGWWPHHSNPEEREDQKFFTDGL